MQSYVKINCSDYQDLVNENKDSNPWSETNLYSNIAVCLFLGIDPFTTDITWPPNYQNKKICIKSSSSETLYPELKERAGSKPFDYYILSVVNLKTKDVYLEGYTDYSTLVQDKNQFKNAFIVSYKDLFPISNLK